MTMEFFKDCQEYLDQYSNRKIRWPWNSYENFQGFQSVLTELTVLIYILCRHTKKSIQCQIWQENDVLMSLVTYDTFFCSRSQKTVGYNWMPYMYLPHFLWLQMKSIIFELRLIGFFHKPLFKPHTVSIFSRSMFVSSH